ncbi:MAG TPA: wax ester/triacylglycerol synthase family O-acyltransferase [Myxococcota bacterium]|jgi:diacylglycerol O-acyltransferase / wax synthase|nr:wax ester/triacylglycerol synthase family O-acyltransferase [Myxococcota bacterium]
MTTRDAGFLYLERPHAPLHIGCLAVCEGSLTLRRLGERIEARLPRLRRYAQRAVPVPLELGHPTWEDDPGFDVHNHLFRWAVPPPGGRDELQEAAAALLTRRLDRSRPLWEMHLFEGLDGGKSALFQMVHHCMIDGVAGAQLLEELLDPSPEVADRFVMLPEPSPLPGAARRMGSALGDAIRRQVGTASSVLGAIRKPAAARESIRRLRDAAFGALQLATADVPVLPWNAPLGFRRALSFTRLPLAGVSRIRATHGGTVNDVVLSVLAGGLHRYLRGNGVPTRGVEAVALVPVSLRKPEESHSLGNRISGMLVPLAVDPTQEVARLAATRAITERLKTSAAWAGIDALLAVLDDVPVPLLAGVGRGIRSARLANVVATNVPGPRETRWLCGTKVEALYPVVPIVDGMGLGLAVFSYDGWLHVGLNADAGLVPDLEKLEQAVQEAFVELSSL